MHETTIIKTPFRPAPMLLIVIIAWVTSGALLAEESAETLLRQARRAYEQGRGREALALADRVIESFPDDLRGYSVRAQFHEAAKQYTQAIADYDAMLKRDPKLTEVYNRRGAAYFKVGNIAASIADFDKAIELDPASEPHHWQRGISYYYAGRYKDGWKQFDIHQTVNPNDVENSVWRFLCMTRAVGIERARKELLPICGDRRIPMASVLALFGGKGTVEDVLAAAIANDPSPERRRRQLFYAHLYIGLFYEATGNAKLAHEHIVRADQEFSVDHYMGDVARVHAAMLNESTQNAPEK